LSKVEADERYASYFGSDQSKYAERSPFAGLLEIDVPLMLAYGEMEPPFLYRQSEKLLSALKEAGRPVRAIRLPGHSHISITYSINTGDTQLSDAMLEFVRRNC
jgi:dipeptidyl aminopeptidase/acylaminoacyl peptidase